MSKQSSKPSSSRKSAAPAKPKVKRPALVGGSLPDGSRFEEGDELDGLDADIIASLEANGIIAAQPQGE